MRHAGRSSTPTILLVITVPRSNQELEALFCYHGVTKQPSAGSFVLFYYFTKQPRAGSFVVYYSMFKGNQVLEALTLLPHLITTRYSFLESSTKGYWHHVNGFLIRLHATLSPRDAAPKPKGSVIDIHILLPHIFIFMFLGTSASRSAYLQTKPRLIASARMSYFRSVRDHF